jgi:hypothetical protein
MGRETVMVLKFHHFRARVGSRFGGVTMSLVVIKCPVTGIAVSTAIETKPSSFRRLKIAAA